MKLTTRTLLLPALALCATALARPAAAQQPYPPQPYPAQPQPYPPQPYPPQPYPPQPYPAQPYPAQPYPPQPPAPAPQSDKRSGNEMMFLYGSSIAYGVGTGIWVDALFKNSDPGLAAIPPLAFGVAAPVGVYFWDEYSKFNRGVPSSISAGLILGAVEGMAISSLNWQHTDENSEGRWSFRTTTTVTWLTATGGGIGGYLFGEWLRPDPRSLAFIGSGAAWGAVAGTLFGAGVTPRRENTDSRADWKDYASVAGFVGYNAGILATGAISAAGYKPSYTMLRNMWLGFVGGTVASSIVYVFYLGSDAPVWHGLIANAAGGVAGIGLGALLTVGSDSSASNSYAPAFKPPMQLGVAPLPGGGGVLSAAGTF